jgi:hypothetical protein
MLRTELRVIASPTKARRPNRPSVGSSQVSEQLKRQRRARREREETTHVGGITQCSNCPPKRHRNDLIRFCPECTAINASRHKAGLIRPKDGHIDHPNNIINPHVEGSYRGQSLMLRMTKRPKGDPIVTECIQQLGGGWRRGIAKLDGVVIYEGPKTRSMDEAWAFAKSRAGFIKDGLRYEGRL